MAKYGSKSLFPIKLQVPLLFTVFALVQNRCCWQSSTLTHLGSLMSYGQLYFAVGVLGIPFDQISGMYHFSEGRL